MKTNFFAFSILLVAGFFGFWGNSRAGDLCFDHILINEIYGGGGNANAVYIYDFVELYNPTDKTIDLTNWTIRYAASSKSFLDTSSKVTILNGKINPKSFYLIQEYGGNNIQCLPLPIPDLVDKINLAADKGRVALVNSTKEITAETDNSVIEIVNYKASKNNKTSAYRTNSCSDVFDTQVPDPQNSSYSKPTPIIYSDKIRINEILPKPDLENTSYNEEFVELYNPSDKLEKLDGWFLKDGANKICDLSGKIIEPAKFLVLENNDAEKCVLALNNTQGEFLGLYNPKNVEPISISSYDGSAKKGLSYAFNGSAWQWTSKITKDAKNEFDEILTGKIKKDENIYAGVYASFEAKTGEKIKKFTWNFGDGHKSYLRKTRHKYEKAGEYNATLKITGDGEENILNFIVSVENFKKTKVQIISFSSNPAGKDSDNEWIEIFNNTKKKVNLKNWSIATGWKKLSNHPIRKDFILKPKETKKLTRDLCAFALGNKKAKIELRYPNGKAADKIKYDRKKDSVDEDEIYQKEGKKWQWITTRTNADTTPTNTETILTGTDATRIDEDEMLIDAENKIEEMDLSDLGKYSADPNQKDKQKKQIALLFAGSNINPKEKILQNQERVLGISATKKTYTKLTEENNSQNFMGKIWKKVNARVNRMMDAF